VKSHDGSARSRFARDSSSSIGVVYFTNVVNNHSIITSDSNARIEAGITLSRYDFSTRSKAASSSRRVGLNPPSHSKAEDLKGDQTILSN
jgi:hypothetical protein